MMRINTSVRARDGKILPRPKVMGHIDPSRAQFTRASTFDTTNSAAGLADGALDVDT